MKRTVRIAVLVVVCFGALAAIVGSVGWEATGESLRNAGLTAFLAVGALTGLVLLLQAGAWRSLNLPIDHRIRFRTLLEAVTTGLAVNILTPSSYLGGEPVKVIFARRMTGLPYPQLAGTVVLSKFLEALSFVLLFAICSAAAVVGFRSTLFSAPNVALGVTLVVVVLVLLVLAGALWISLARRWCPLTRILRWIRAFRPRSRRLARLSHRTREMERQVARVFRQAPSAGRLAFGYLFLTHLAMFLKPAAFFLIGSRVGLSIPELGLIFVVSQALLAFQLTPSGVGTLDGGLIGAFAIMGLTSADGMAYLLCLRLWDGAVVAAGALIAFRLGVRLRGASEKLPE